MEITRGNNKSFKFKRTREIDKSIIEEKPKEMYITFKTDPSVQEALFQKKLSDNTISYSEEDKYYRFEILPEDTENLLFSNYYYDIKVITNDDKKRTIQKGILEVTCCCTHKANEV